MHDVRVVLCSRHSDGRPIIVDKDHDSTVRGLHIHGLVRESTAASFHQNNRVGQSSLVLKRATRVAWGRKHNLEG